MSIPRRHPQNTPQLTLALTPRAAPREQPVALPLRTAEELLARLRAAGLRGITRCRLTRNRAVMVSFRDGELRVHEGYRSAPPEVLSAIVGFVNGETAAIRRASRAAILAYNIERPPRTRRRERTPPADEAAVHKLRVWHARYNERFFGGALRAVDIRISRRLRARLGHYSAASPSGDPAEIVISARHIRRHGWAEALHTLLHEMVHQWQDELRHPIDHGRRFRQKAREIGIAPTARRQVQPAGSRGARADVPPPYLNIQAARED